MLGTPRAQVGSPSEDARSTPSPIGLTLLVCSEQPEPNWAHLPMMLGAPRAQFGSPSLDARSTPSPIGLTLPGC